MAKAPAVLVPARQPPPLLSISPDECGQTNNGAYGHRSVAISRKSAPKSDERILRSTVSVSHRLEWSLREDL